MELVRLYARLIGARFRGQLHYRVSFVLALFGSATGTAIEFGAILVLFSRIQVMAGWSVWEVALLYAIAETSFATAELVGSGLDDFQIRIGQGTFDRVLTRPRGAFFQVLADDLALRRGGRVAQGLVVLVVATRHLAIGWTPDKLLVLVMAMLCGIAIFFSVFVLAASFCFWTVEGKEATHIVSYGGVTLVDYPIDIYAGWLQRFVTFVLPLAFVSYYPVLYLLDRPDPLGLPAALRLLSPVAALLLGG
ncbi:MAG: ABC-2 family transporter protein, partial [Chloroflexi bacterium]|nr:ABC-2 family transporter protein [Chloroflexota bacterium]